MASDFIACVHMLRGRKLLEGLAEGMIPRGVSLELWRVGSDTRAIVEFVVHIGNCCLL